MRGQGMRRKEEMTMNIQIIHSKKEEEMKKEEEDWKEGDDEN